MADKDFALETLQRRVTELETELHSPDLPIRRKNIAEKSLLDALSLMTRIQHHARPEKKKANLS